MLIKIHSFTDIVTNSSTTVYSHLVGNGVDMIKELIEEVLKSVGSEKKVNDLFEIKEVFNSDNFMDYVCDNLEEYFTGEQIKTYEKMDWKMQSDFILENLQKEMETYYLNYDDGYYGATYDSSISIKLKTEDKDLGNLVNGLFEHLACRDG